MYEELIIAGFGGQGIIFAGTLLAYAAMEEGKEVVGFPAYGIEVRGGTANYSVIIASEEIYSPIVFHPNSIVVMNLPSLLHFEPMPIPNGLIVMNSTLIDRNSTRGDVVIISIPATAIAETIGNIKIANMVALGAYIAYTKAVSVSAVISAQKILLKGKGEMLISQNEKAFIEGVNYPYNGI